LREDRRGRLFQNTGRMVKNTKIREARLGFSVHGLESKKGKLQFDAPLLATSRVHGAYLLKTRYGGFCVSGPTYLFSRFGYLCR